MINKELNYPGENIGASELKSLVDETLDDQEGDGEEEEVEEEEVKNNQINEELTVPNHQVFN